MTPLLLSGPPDLTAPIGGWLRACPLIHLRRGHDFLGVADRLQAETALREKDPSRPWDPDPTDHLASIRVHLQVSLCTDTHGRVVRAPFSGDEHPAYASDPARCRRLLPGCRLITVGARANGDPGPDHLHLAAEALCGDTSAVLLQVRAFLGLPARLLPGPLDPLAAGPGERWIGGAEPDPWIARIGIADLDALKPHLPMLRQHPDAAVRGALGRWLVRQGVRPVVVESICALEGEAWYREAEPLISSA